MHEVPTPLIHENYGLLACSQAVAKQAKENAKSEGPRPQCENAKKISLWLRFECQKRTASCISCPHASNMGNFQSHRECVHPLLATSSGHPYGGDTIEKYLHAGEPPVNGLCSALVCACLRRAPLSDCVRYYHPRTPASSCRVPASPPLPQPPAARSLLPRK